MKKGIVLAGGYGTRLYPLTKCMSKQLLPVYDKPMIYYPLSVLMLAGIADIFIICTKEDHSRFRGLLGDGADLGISITYAIQPTPGGIAQSFLMAEEFIGVDSVALILGDNIFHGSSLESILKTARSKSSGASVFATEVETPEKYGVVEKDENGNVIRLIEKPLNPPSNLAVTGLYFYDNRVVDFAKKLKPSKRGELEITDINNAYLDDGDLNVAVFDKTVSWFDTGSFEALYAAAGYVRKVQSNGGELVGSIEKIAHQNGWISKNDLSMLSEKYSKSGYGNRIMATP